MSREHFSWDNVRNKFLNQKFDMQKKKEIENFYAWRTLYTSLRIEKMVFAVTS